MYFPRPYPDELTSSLLIRASRHLGIPFDKVLKDLTGVGRKRLHFLNPFALKKIADSTGMAYDEILVNHTLYPYVTAFMTNGHRERLRASLVAAAPQIRSDFNWLVGAPWSRLACRRFCPECLLDDLREHGESYWHRLHVLPGVYTCTKHRSPLLGTDIPLGWCEPSRAQACPSDDPGIEIVLPLSKHLLDAVAMDSKDALEGNFSARLDEIRAHAQHVEELGLSFSKGCVPRCLSSQLEKFYGTAYLTYTNVSWPNFRMSVERRPALMIRQAETATFTTLQYLLLQIFFENFPSATLNRRN
ncbi:TniQ family protein [Paraburkholderia sp. IMGN_8]|uniref:TniQ family protein n=1 Tax=Paraburkholderia sp. IMGN_8 TaxID=3136564 RepID=UPI0031017B7F